MSHLVLKHFLSPDRAATALRMPPDGRLADQLRWHLPALCSLLMKNVADWDKYARGLTADPGAAAAFAREEFQAGIDYLIRYLATGDTTFRHLYIGEKFKISHLPEFTPEQQAEKRAAGNGGGHSPHPGLPEGQGRGRESGAARVRARFDASSPRDSAPAAGGCRHDRGLLLPGRGGLPGGPTPGGRDRAQSRVPQLPQSGRPEEGTQRHPERGDGSGLL